MKDCLELNNLDVQEWIDKEGINVTYTEYLEKGYLPDYKDWTGKTVSLDESKNILNTLFDLDNIGIEDFSNLIYDLPLETSAAYLQQVIYLNKNPQKADVYEEGFHAIMDNFLTTDEKQSVLKAGQSVLKDRLKKEGKTINQYVKELIIKYPTIYGRLSNEKALERAFEEEIASMFVDSFDSKNYLKQESDINKKLSPYFGDSSKGIAIIISKFFNFLKELYNKFLGNQDVLSTFFEDIKKGKFKNNKIINGENSESVPHTRLLELYTTKFNRVLNKETQYLSHSLTSEATQRVIRNVGAIFFQLENAKLYNSITERINESIKLYFKLESDFKDVNLDLEANLEALDALKEDVKDYIEVFSSITDFDSDTIESEEETQNDFAKFESSSNESSTFENSFSKQLRLRIGKTGRVKRIENIKVEGKTYPIKLIESVNVLNTYYSFARTLGNTSSDKDRWNRLYAFSNLNGNPDAKAFVDTLLYDLFRDKVNNKLSFDAAVKQIKELYEAKTDGFLIFPEEGINLSNEQIEENRKKELEKIATDIFPDTKVKEIVYRGGNITKEEFSESEDTPTDYMDLGNGLYLSANEKIAKEYGNVRAVIVNIKNPNDANKVAKQRIDNFQNDKEQPSKFDENGKYDGVVDLSKNIKNTYELVVFNSNQIHILTEKELNKIDEINKKYDDLLTNENNENVKKTISSDNASIINSILKGFDLWKRNEYILTVNTIKKEHKLFDANLESVKSSQYNNWTNSLQELYNNQKGKEETKYKPIEINNPVINNYESFDNEVKFISNYFKTLNIQISEEYIKYSLLAPLTDIDRSIVGVDDNTLDSLYKNFKIPNDVLLINSSLKQINKNINAFMSTGDIKLITDYKDGIKGYLQTIAEGNGYFDERIPDNTFKSADGKTKFNYQNKTFFLQKIDEILNNSTNPDTYKTLIGKNKYLTEGTEFIENNWLKKKFTDPVSLGGYSELLNDGKIFSFSANGLRQSDSYVDQVTNQKIKVGEEDGVSAGDMSTRDFSIYLLGAAASNDTTSTTPVYVGNFEASKTYEFVNLPVIKDLISNNGTVTQTAIDLVKNEFEKEFNRINKYAKTLNTTKYEKYNSGKVAKINYGTDSLNYFYIPYKVKDGKKVIDFSSYRSMQFSDYVGNLINDEQYNLSKSDLQTLNEIINNGNTDEFTVESLDLSDNLLTKALLNKPFEINDDVVSAGINNILDDSIDYFETEGVINPNNVNVLLDEKYTQTNVNLGFKNGQLKNNIKKILLSNMFNSMFLNQLLHGDQALLYKNDMVDMFKRFKGRNAAINSSNTSTIALELGITKVWETMDVMVHDEIKATSSINGKTIDLADAQNYGTSNYFRYFDYSLGRLSKNKSELYDLIDQGEDTKHLDKKIFDLKMFITVLKTVFFDGYTYYKKSDFMLTKRLTSLFTQIDEKTANENGELINGRWKPKIGATIETVKWSNGNYYEVLPRPEKILLHDRRKTMEGWRYDNVTNSWRYSGNEIMLSMPVSASKMLNINVLKGSDLKSEGLENSIRTIDLKYYGLQVESSMPHDKIPQPTQYLEIALNELKKDGTTKFNIDGKLYSTMELLSLYENAKTSRDDIRLEELMNEIIDKNSGSFKEKEFRTRFAKSLESSGADKQTIELVSKGYSLNHPLIKEKFIAQVFSHFTKDGLSQKVAGDSAPHVSSYGMKLIKQSVKEIVDGKDIWNWKTIATDSEEYNRIINTKTDAEWQAVDFGDLLFYPDVEGDTISKSHVDKDGKNISLQNRLKELGENQYFIDELRHFKPRIKDGKVTGYFDEAILSKYNINQNVISKDEKYMFAVRIPSQDKHSGVNIEWVEMFEAYHGSVVSVSKEIVQLSGSDFDVDKLFIHKNDGYYDDNDNFIPYKNDLKSTMEYNLTNHKELKDLIKVKKLEDINYQKYNTELKTSNAIKQKDYLDFKQLLEDFEKQIVGYEGKEDLKDFYKIKRFLENQSILDNIDFEDKKNRNRITKLNAKQDELYNEITADINKISSQFNEYESIKNLYQDYYSSLNSINNVQVGLKTNLSAINERIQEIALNEFEIPNSSNNLFDFYKKQYEGFSNRGYINNLLLQAQQQALANIETMDGKIADTSASLNYLDDVLKEFPIEDDKYLLSNDGKTFVGSSKKKIHVHSMIGHITTHRNVSTGKKNIGVDVNWNLLDIVLNRLDVQINPKNTIKVEINGKKESFDSLQFFLNHKMESDGEYLRVFDVLSTMISSATDEAKEQLNARYGLTVEALNAILPLVAMGGNLSIGIALVNQPIVKQFLSYKAKKSYGILTKEEGKLKYFNNEKIVEAIFDELKINNADLNDLNLGYYSINDLANGLRGNLDKKSNQSLAMLRDFLKLSEITEYGGNVIEGIKTKKGLATDIYTFNNSLEKLAKISSDKEVVDDESPFYIKEKIYKKNPLAKEMINKINIIKNINNILPKLIALKSPIFTKFRDAVKIQGKDNWNTVEQKELDSELESFIYSQLLYKSLEEAGQYDALLLKYLKGSLIDVNSPDNIIKVFEAFTIAIKNEPLLNENALIKKLRLMEESGISFLKLNQLVKLNGNQMTELADAFMYLAKRPYEINSGISPLELTKALQALYIIKDGMQFKYNGISKIFPVEVFSRMSANIDEVMSNSENVQSLFNDVLVNEFQKRYFESVKHQNSSKVVNIYKEEGNNQEYLFQKDANNQVSFTIFKDKKGSSLTFDITGKLLKYIKLNFGKNTFNMKLTSNKNGIFVYDTYQPIGTSNSTLMGLPIENNNYIKTDVQVLENQNITQSDTTLEEINCK